MRRPGGLLTLYTVTAIAALAAGVGCGGKKSTPTTGAGVPAKVVISPSGASVTLGVSPTLTFSATVQDSAGNAVTGQTITFQSSNTAVAQIASSGLVCAGTWDSLTTPIVCTPGPVGSAQITATSGSLTSDPATVFVHGKVDQIVVTPSITNPCISQGQTQQFSAKAFSAGQDITSQVGPFGWNSVQTGIVTVDSNGLASAVQPGQGGIFAQNSGAASPAATFVTCPVQSITLSGPDPTTSSFTVDPTVSTTQTLTVVAKDSLGATVTAPQLTFILSQPVVGSIAGSIFTSIVAGTTNIVATCTPPACNTGLNVPVYSNVLTAKVTGTANTTTVYVAGTSSTSLVPIDTSTNTAGTAITLTQTPNSLLIDPQGLNAYLGSAGGVMKVNLTAGTVTTATGLIGQVLAISPNNSKLIVYNAATSDLSVFDIAGNSFEALKATGVTRAAFSPDAFKAFLVAGSTLYIYSPVFTLRNLTLAAAANDVAFHASGSAGFFAGGAASGISARATCDNSAISVGAAFPGIPSRIQALPDGSAMLAVDTTSIDVLPASVNNALCPPVVSFPAGASAQSFGSGVFAPRQLLVSADGANAFVLSDQPKVLVYKVAGATTSSIALSGGASAFSGGLTLDGTQLYLGGSDNNIHRIDIAAGSDAQQISISFTPDLVAVRPK
jgi:hypothetical protein